MARFFLHILFRCAVCVLALSVVVPDAVAAPAATAVSSSAKKKKKTSSGKKRAASKKKSRRTSGKKTARRRKSRSRVTARRPAVQTLWMSDDSASWIHRGAKGIIIYRDSLGVTRAMQPCSSSANAGHSYAAAISQYARTLLNDGVRVYMLMAPSQGEYYMPPGYGSSGSEQRCIAATASFLDSIVRPVMVDDTLRAHLSEEIYNRTDHHWAPLGAYYAAGALAAAAGVEFRPLSAYTPRVIRDYVGTMYKFSGDPMVKNSPEDFVYYLPPEGYEAEFITYTLRGGKTSGESAPHRESFFKEFPDGSGAAYLTFMGGDTRTVKVKNTGGTPGRRLLIVKDSFGNAMAPCLFGSFEEVHVVDFRFFPHNLTEYARRNGITDMVFVNCVSIALNPNTAARLFAMHSHNDGNKFDEPVEIPQEEATDATDAGPGDDTDENTDDTDEDTEDDATEE